MTVDFPPHILIITGYQQDLCGVMLNSCQCWQLNSKNNDAHITGVLVGPNLHFQLMTDKFPPHFLIITGYQQNLCGGTIPVSVTIRPIQQVGPSWKTFGPAHIFRYLLLQKNHVMYLHSDIVPPVSVADFESLILSGEGSHGQKQHMDIDGGIPSFNMSLALDYHLNPFNGTGIEAQ